MATEQLCPRCKLKQLNRDGEGYFLFHCGSKSYFGRLSTFEQSEACREMEFANKHIEDLTNACESFRDSVLHESGPLEVNYVLGMFDDTIARKL